MTLYVLLKFPIAHSYARFDNDNVIARVALNLTIPAAGEGNYEIFREIKTDTFTSAQTLENETLGLTQSSRHTGCNFGFRKSISFENAILPRLTRKEA
jgi:hypothetical protein